MKKQLVIIGITVLLSIVGFSGCIDNKNANTPPTFGTPTPTNGSTGNPLSLTWSIPINDPEGNTFTWTIQCNNTQKNNGTTTTNGTKILSLTGLKNQTTYKIWINATDPTGSGQYTRNWYTFTTKTNKTNGGTGTNVTTGKYAELLIGRWTASFGWVQFDEDKTYIRCNATSGASQIGTYELTDNKLTVQVSYQGKTITGNFTIKFLNNNTLENTDQGGITSTSTRLNVEFNEKILGKWWATTPNSNGTAQFYFYANGSYYAISPSGNGSWDKYTMIGNTLTIKKSGYVCECIFSDNDNKVEAYHNGKLNTTLTRQ